MPRTIRGDLRGDGLRVAVLVSRWHPEVTDRLLDGALKALGAAGVREGDVVVVQVPGAYELPQAAAALAGRVDAIVALGCLLRGETHHDRIIADACAQGLTEVATRTGVPVGFGVVTADTREQALARSGPSRAASSGGSRAEHGGNKGAEAAEAAVRLAVALRRALDGETP